MPIDPTRAPLPGSPLSGVPLSGVPLPGVPWTRASIRADLAALGVRRGMTLLTHSSLAGLGWTVGGAEAVILALLDVLGPEGTLMAPTFSGDLTDPATWTDPAVPEAWHETIRANLPPYHPERTPTRGMGKLSEALRRWPGAVRSGHPVLSFAALGPRAAEIVASHALDWGFGEGSPLGRLYDLDGFVLLLGVGHARNSSLHLAETRARNRRVKRFRFPVERDGVAVWEEHDEVADDQGRLFPRVGADFEAAGGVAIGRVGKAEARLMRQRALVEFAIPALEAMLIDAQER